jgi:hypothetical protein
MKINWLSSALMTFILFAFLSGANGAEPVALSSQQGGALANFDNSAPYTEYYESIMGSVPTSLLTVPAQVDLTSKAPAYVYLGTAMQKVDYSTYQPAAVSNSLWLAGATSWSQYAVVPQGSLVNLLAISTKEGQGTFVVYHPNGQRYDFNSFLFPTSQLQLYANAPGSYQVSFIMDGAASNTVMIYALSTTPTSGETGYLAGETGGDYLASVFGVPKTSMGPQAGLDNKAALKEYQKKINSEYWSSSDNDIAWSIGTDRWLNAA